MSANIICRIDASAATFVKSYGSLPDEVLREAKKIIGHLLLLDVTKAPAKLHLHNLQNRTAWSIENPKVKVKCYTVHVTPDDNYKASFTLENGTAYMRYAGKHDSIDKNP